MGHEVRASPAFRERPRPSNSPEQQDHDSSIKNDAELNTVPCIPGKMQEYDVSKPVGKGGYAVVYKATRKDDGKVVAIKLVEIFEMNPKKRDRCLQEVTLLQQLDHPNIIQMLDAFIDENKLVIVFEWAPAGDLRRLLKRTAETGKVLEEPTIWNFFMQVLKGVRYMHQNRIMHRDIKPANVLVGANGMLKIGDLGLGRQLSEETLEAFSKVGTPYYVSPEVVKGGGYDWKSDVWSLGCLLYELAALRSPFEMEGANLYDVFQKISKCEYAPLNEAQFSPDLRQLVVAMLCNNPAQRPSVEDVYGVATTVMQAQKDMVGDLHSQSETVAEQLVVVAAAASKDPQLMRLSPVPLKAVQCVHPLFLAERAPGSTKSKMHQLVAVLQLMVWLLKLIGQLDAAQGLLSHLNLPPHASFQDSPPTSIDFNATANAIKQAGTKLGINLEYAPTAQLTQGYGRGICSIMKDLVDKVMKKLQVGCEAPQHAAGNDDIANVAEGGDRDDELEENNADMLLRTSGCLGMGADAEEEGRVYGLPLGPSNHGQAVGRRSRKEISSQVDPVAWRAECERLAPKLGHIKLQDGVSTDWGQRLSAAKDAFAKVTSRAEEARGDLRLLGGTVEQQLERIAHLEHLLQANCDNAPAIPILQQQLATVQQQHQALGTRVQQQLHALAQRDEQMRAAQESIKTVTSSLDSTAQLVGIRDAVKKVREEIQTMDVHIGLVAGRLGQMSCLHRIVP